MARYVVPIDSNLGSSSVGGRGQVSSQTKQAMRSALGAARASVDQAQQALNRKRQQRLGSLLEKATFKDGFVQAQSALIQSSKSVDIRGLVGSLNSPFLENQYDAKSKEALNTGAISSLEVHPNLYSLQATSPSPVRSPGPCKVVSIVDNYSTECPINSDPNSSEQDKQAEIASIPSCIYGKHVVVEINGLHVIYGNLDTISVSVNDSVADEAPLGTASSLLFAGTKPSSIDRIESFLLYTESISPDTVPAESASSTYNINNSSPYGPHWKKTRPGGLPESARKCSARGESLSRIEEVASQITQDSTFKKAVKVFADLLTGGGYISMPSSGFDVRCTVEELPLEGTECFLDTGPFPRGTSFTLVSASTRSSREAFKSNWGTFQVSMLEWSRMHSSARFMDYTHSEQVTGNTPWDATEDEEISSPLKLMYGVWQNLSDAGALYRTLAAMTAITSINALSELSNKILASSEASLNLKCKEAWNSLGRSDEHRGVKTLIENLVIHSKNSVSSKVPEVLEGLSDEEKPDYEYKGSQGWQSTPPHTWVKFDAFPIGSGNSTKSYPFIRIGTPHQQAFSRAHQRILELGGRFTSSGGRRALSASRFNGIGMHNVGRAFDLGIATGLVVDPNSTSPDSCYLVIADNRAEIRTLYTVWAKVFPEEGDPAAIEAARSDGTIVNKTFDVDVYSTRWPRVTDKRVVQWTGEAFNVTQILAENGYVRIRPISDYYERNSYMGIEWWHYETREGLIEGVTKIEDEVQKYYTYEEAAVNSRTRHPNWERVKNRLWSGTYFR